MNQLDHQNVVRVLHHGEGTYTKPSGVKTVKYLVLELYENGELFDILAMTGPFSDKFARYYFK